MAKTPRSAAKPSSRGSGTDSGPRRRQLRQIASLVGRLEAAGAVEARRRHQLQVALEKGRKTKRRHRDVEQAAARVVTLIERLRTLARELDSPVPRVGPPATPAKAQSARTTPKPAVKVASKPAARTTSKPAARPVKAPVARTAPNAASKPAAKTAPKRTARSVKTPPTT